MIKKVVRYPISVEDAGDHATNVLDGEGVYIFYKNTELSLNQWQFIVKIHTQNPVGHKNISLALQNAARFWEKS